MQRLARFVIARRRWILLGWLLLAVAGAYAAPKATSALSYDFSLPGQAGYETNQQIVAAFGGGGDNAPILLIAGNGRERLTASSAALIVATAARATPGARTVSYRAEPSLLSADRRTGVVLVYPRRPGARTPTPPPCPR